MKYLNACLFFSLIFTSAYADAPKAVSAQNSGSKNQAEAANKAMPKQGAKGNVKKGSMPRAVRANSLPELKADGLYSNVQSADQKFILNMEVQAPKEFKSGGELYLELDVALQDYINGKLPRKRFTFVSKQILNPKFPFKISLKDSDFDAPDLVIDDYQGMLGIARVKVRYCVGCVQDRLMAFNDGQSRYAAESIFSFEANKQINLGALKLQENFMPPQDCPEGKVFWGGEIKASGADSKLLEGKKDVFLAVFRGQLWNIRSNLNRNDLSNELPLAVSPVEFRGGVAKFSINGANTFAPQYRSRGNFIFRLFECPGWSENPAECVLIQQRYSFANRLKIFNLALENGKAVKCGAQNIGLITD